MGLRSVGERERRMEKRENVEADVGHIRDQNSVSEVAMWGGARKVNWRTQGPGNRQQLRDQVHSHVRLCAFKAR